MILAAVLGAMSLEFFVEFPPFGCQFGTLISIGLVVIEEMTYHRCNNPRDLVHLIATCFLEHIPPGH